MVNKTSRIPAGFTLVEEDDEVEVKETPTTTEVKEEVEETSEVKETSAVPAGFTLVEEDDEVEEKETTTEVEETKGYPYTTWSGETKYHKKIKVPEAHRPMLPKTPKEITPVEEEAASGDLLGVPKGVGVGALPKPKSIEEENRQRMANLIASGGTGTAMLGSDALSQAAYPAVTDLLTWPVQAAQAVGELVAPELIKPVTDFASNINKELKKNQIWRFISDSAEGKDLHDVTDLASRIPTWLIPSQLAIKHGPKLFKKALKEKEKLKKMVGVLLGGATYVVSDVQTRKDDPSEAGHTKGMIEMISPLLDEPKLLKEAIEITEALEINPDDTTQQRRQKQFLDSLTITAGMGGLASGVVKAVGVLFNLGGKGAGAAIRQAKKSRNESKAVDDGLLEVPENTPTSRINSSEVVEEVVEEGAEPVLKQRNKVTEVLAKINTKAGRMLSNNAALPAKVFNAALQRSRADKASDLEVKVGIEDLLRVQKQTGDSDELLAKFFNEGIDAGLDPRLREQANLLKRTIVNKEAEINKLLGLTGKDKIGLGFNNGDVYFTRMFEAVNNPTYLKQIQKALKGEKVDSSFISKVENAKNYLRNKGVPEDELEGTIMGMVTRLSGAKEEGLFLSNLAEEIGKTSGRAAQVLRKKQKIDTPILELLGQQKDPIAKISATISNQNKVIAELQYLTSVDKFFRKNIGKEVDLGGLIPRLGGARKKIHGGKNPGINETKKLQDLSEEAIGRFGGSTKLLQNIYVDPQTYRYLQQGLELFNPKKGGWFSNTFSHLAAYGQATQTIMDLPAYLINTYGATQALISNGVFFNTKLASQAATAAKTFGQTLAPVRTAKLGFIKVKGIHGYVNREALAKLDKLKKAGVIDTDLTSEMIAQNINVYGKRVTSKAGKAGEFYQKGMQKLSTAYGSPDTYSKLLAFEAEHMALLKMFPRAGKESVKAHKDRIFNMAAERVRDTMPSYAVAAPLARSLSRMPIGTYALFPSEMVRTTKNILKYAVKDTMQGLKNNNMAQATHGLKRLTGLGITGVGTDYVVNNNNEQLGVTNVNSRAIDMLSPDWGKSGKRYHNTNFMLNEDGTVTAKWVNSYSFDAQDYLKVPVRAITGKLLAGGKVSDVEIDETMKGMAKSVIGPFTNPKFVTEAIIDIIRQEYSEAPEEEGISIENISRVWDELRPAVQPGTWQVIDKWQKSLTSETLRELNKGQNRYGFPQTSEDIKAWFFTGMRPTTMNLEKSIGFTMSQEIKKIKSTRDAFMHTLGRLDDQPYTPQIREDLVNRYKELQDAKFRAMQDLSDKVQIFKQITYDIPELKNKKGKVIREKQTGKPFGLTKVLSAVTDGFNYEIADEVLYANRVGEGLEAEGGIFMPDLLHTDEGLRRQLERKSFGHTLLADLADASAEYAGRTLKESKSKIPEGFTLVE